MREPEILGVSRDQVQRRRLHLPKGDLKIADGRKLREIIGYREILSNHVIGLEPTKRDTVELRGWNHPPTEFLVSASVLRTPNWGHLLHISMSYPDHDPSWDEIKMLREVFFPPDVDAAMFLPRASNYVNVHRHCFHLWQTPQEWGIG